MKTTKFSASLSLPELELCRAHAWKRIQNKPKRRFSDGTSNTDQLKNATAAVAAEYCFARVFGTPMNWRILANGDPGFDTILANVPIEIKATTYATGVLHLHDKKEVDRVRSLWFSQKLVLVLAITTYVERLKSAKVFFPGFVTFPDFDRRKIEKTLNPKEHDVPALTQAMLGKPEKLVEFCRATGDVSLFGPGSKGLALFERGSPDEAALEALAKLKGESKERTE